MRMLVGIIFFITMVLVLPLLKMMTLLDEYTRQSLVIGVERQITATQGAADPVVGNDDVWDPGAYS